jgi:hypothetical protein
MATQPPVQATQPQDQYAALYKTILSAGSGLPAVTIVQAEGIPIPSISGLEVGDLPAELRRRLQTAQGGSGQEFTTSSFPPGTEVVPQAEIDTFFHGSGDGWARFRERFPGAGGYHAFSRPILTADLHDGIIYIESHCGWLCGWGGYAWLHRDSSTSPWTVKRSIAVWES